MEQEKKYGIVFAGGGAKGAYQAGVLLAMQELDLIKDIEAAAGASVGHKEDTTVMHTLHSIANRQNCRDLTVEKKTLLPVLLHRQDLTTNGTCLQILILFYLGSRHSR